MSRSGRNRRAPRAGDRCRPPHWRDRAGTARPCRRRAGRVRHRGIGASRQARGPIAPPAHRGGQSPHHQPVTHVPGDARQLRCAVGNTGGQASNRISHGANWHCCSTRATTRRPPAPSRRSALALFLGVAMSITAFPVLARILTDRGMHRTSTGVLALACAAVDDIIAWTLLAFVVAVVQGNGPLDVLRIVVLTAVFAGVMFGLVRPALRRLNDWYRRVGPAHPGHPGRGADRRSGLRLHHRDHRHPRDLRCVHLRRHHAAGGCGRHDHRDPGAAGAGQRAAAVPAVLRGHRPEHQHRRDHRVRRLAAGADPAGGDRRQVRRRLRRGQGDEGAGPAVRGDRRADEHPRSDRAVILNVGRQLGCWTTNCSPCWC